MSEALHYILVKVFKGITGKESGEVELSSQRLLHEICKYFPHYAGKTVQFALQNNGYTTFECPFSQVTIYCNHLFQSVVTEEYSDNTGDTYYCFYETVEEYNKAVMVDLTGVR